MLQSLASYVAALVLGPSPGSRILDMCAAPGGKTTAMAQLMGDRGEVVALDQSHRKVWRLKLTSAQCISYREPQPRSGLDRISEARATATSAMRSSE